MTCFSSCEPFGLWRAVLCYNRQICKFTLWFRRWMCVSLPLKDLADSDPEPSTMERLGAGPGSGFKWESSVGEPHLSHQACIALLFFYLTFNLWLYSLITNNCRPFPSDVFGVHSWLTKLFVTCFSDGHQLCMWGFVSVYPRKCECSQLLGFS